MTSSPDDASDPSRSTLSRMALWGGSILGGLLVLVLAAALLIPRLFTSEELKGYVVPPLEEATGRTVEIDEIGLRVLWTPAVSVSGFRLADREGYGPEPAVSAGALNVEVALWPLLTASIEPTAVELVDPTIRYEISEDGVANFDDLMASDSTAAEEEDGALAVPVSDFRATGARVRYVDRSTGQALDLDFDARLRALLDGESVESAGTVEVQALRALLPDVNEDTLAVTDARVTYDVRADLEAGRADLADLTVETAPLTLTTTGAVTRLTTRPTLDLTVETTEADLARLAAFAPAAAVEGVNPTGTLELTTTVRGPLPDSTGATDSLVVDGTGRLAGLGLDYQGTALLRDLQADLTFSLEEAALRSVQGQLLGADLAGNAAVTDPTGTPQVAMDVQTGAMTLADLAALAPPEQTEGVNPRGTLRLDATVEGPMPEGTDSLEELAIDGTGQLAGAGVDYDGAALLRDLGADLAFSGTSAAVQGIEGQLLGERLEGAVTIRDPMGDATVEGRLAGAADLSELSALTAEEGSNETSSIAGRAEYDVQFSGPVDDPDAIRPTGEVRLADVQYPYESFRHPIEVPDATVQLTGTGLSMDRFTIRSGEQTMALAATARNLFPVSTGLAETDPAMALDFTFTADRLDLVALYPEATGDTSEVYYSQLFAATLSGSQVNGRSPEAVAKTLYGGTELPAYDVDGRVEIGTFLNDPQRIDDLALDVQMRDRRL
ncbi:MAG: AsmA family protein, partial [Salinivenus sp.]